MCLFKKSNQVLTKYICFEDFLKKVNIDDLKKIPDVIIEDITSKEDVSNGTIRRKIIIPTECWNMIRKGKIKV